MDSRSSSPPTYRPGDKATALPTPPLRVGAGPPPWGAGHQQQARGSSAQSNLRRIIAVISTVLPPQTHPNAFQSQLVPRPAPLPPQAPEGGERESRVLSTPSDAQQIRVDLRLRLGPPCEIGRPWGSTDEEDHDAGLPSSACSAVGEGSTKLTEGGGGSSGTAAPGTVESGVVSASYDGAHGPGALDSNSPGQRSSEGECDAGGEGGAGAEEEAVKQPRAEKEEEEEGRGGGEGRPCSEITNIRGNTSGGTEESDATKGGAVRIEVEVGVEKKKHSNNTDSDNDTDIGRRWRRCDEGHLGLLLEAVRQVSGALFGDEEGKNHPPRKEEEDEQHAEEGRAERSKRGRCWAARATASFELYEVVGQEEQALAPVVRSKRGRSQALPSRYRDSVLEPWRKQSAGGGGGHRQLLRGRARTRR